MGPRGGTLKTLGMRSAIFSVVLECFSSQEPKTWVELPLRDPCTVPTITMYRAKKTELVLCKHARRTMSPTPAYR